MKLHLRMATKAAGWVLCCVASFVATNRAAAAVAEAYAGAPFGVGRVELSVGGAGAMAPLEDERFTVRQDDGRVLYPVVRVDPGRRLLRQLLEIDRPRNVTVYFLFRGDAPFQMQSYSPQGQVVQVAPRVDARGHARLLAEWWAQYVNRWESLRKNPQFPPVVENFLAANLARRLGLTLPEPQPSLLAALAPKKTPLDDLMISEQHQLTIDQQLAAGEWSAGGPLEPLPPQMPWYDLPTAPEAVAGVAAEPLAQHVPAECFYVRFGSFPNYLWFRDLNRKWQGDLGNMILRRGIHRAASDRIEGQLSLRENAMAKILGPQVIADVAIIGLDPYVNQGAAIGVLFQARVTPLLARDLTEQRREALTKFPDAVESTVKIGERDVSLIATPGGEVRSYYVADGDFHLVTTSARLVQRFLQASAGDRSLAASAGFLGMRQKLPHDRGDAVFAYVPPELFRELTSPGVWIEAQRRARVQREAKVLELARLEAAAEGIAASTPQELVDAGLLPAGFGTHPDGSTLIEDEAGFSDSARGRLGLFTTVGEMEVTGATAAEAAAYRRFADRFRQEIGQLPPIGVALARTPLADGSGETLTAEVIATPLSGVKLGRLPDILGEPASDRVPPIDGDVVRLEVVLKASPLALLGGGDELHHLFVGLRDFRSPLIVRQGSIRAGAPPAELVRMYVGAWPKPGLLKMFSGPQLAEGQEPTPAAQEAWQAKRDEFLLMSFKPDLIREVLPQLAVEPAPRPAQLWVNVDDLTGKELAAAVNALGYSRTRESAVSATRLMNTLANQLHVSPAEARTVAERLVDGTFECPLGGEYALVDLPDGQAAWTSTALTPQNQFLLTEPPADFQLPVLSWFKGLRGDLRLADEELAAHVEIDMAQSAMP
jgi:hypothetical protein